MSWFIGLHAEALSHMHAHIYALKRKHAVDTQSFLTPSLPVKLGHHHNTPWPRMTSGRRIQSDREKKVTILL